MKYNNILFDLDGTITEPEKGIINGIIYALNKCPYIDLSKSREIYQKCIKNLHIRRFFDITTISLDSEHFST